MVTSLARRLELLEAAGADAVVIEPFTREFSSFGPEAFVDDVLIAEFDLTDIEAQRRNWCVFRDRRPDLYGALTTHDAGG